MADADVLFVNGALFSAGMGSSRAGALAVRGGRIEAVGRDLDLHALRGPRTEVVDLAGGLLLPGFQDAHVHPVMAGVNLLRCDLHHTESASQALAVIAEYADAHPQRSWVVGAGWSMEHFPGGTPTRGQLDSVVPDRPAHLTNRDGHGAWVNTRALALAGITADTPDPVDGRIEREADGSPSGVLHEGAVRLVEHLLPATGPDEQLAGLTVAQEHLLSLGVTAWQDAAVGEMFGMADILPVYIRAAGSGELRARVVGALWWDRERGAEQIPELVERRAAGEVGRLRCSTVKVMQDGVAENFTAAMTEPYLDGCGCPTANSGLSFVDPGALREHVTDLDRLGFQVHFHALGDRAVREALDAVEAALRTNGPSDGRHHLAHLQVVHPDDIPRFAALGATATIQALWACHEPQMDELTIPHLGERRAQWQYPFAGIARAGGALAAGSDWSVSSADPIQAIHVAVTRTAPGAPDGAEPLGAEQALTLAQALTAYTAGSARVNHLDQVAGRLEPGLAADLVVLDRDPFRGPVGEIASSRVSSTWIDGHQVHAAQG